MSHEAFTELPEHEDLSVEDCLWVPMTVSAGAYTSKVTAIANLTKCLIIPLADHSVSIFSLSSYHTDFILVRENDISKAVSILSSGSVTASGRQTETVPLDKFSLTDGNTDQPASRRPVTHHFHIPENQFHIASIDPDMLSSAGLSIIQLLFYPPCEKLKGDKGLCGDHVEHFSCYLVAEDKITLVVDAKRFQSLSNLGIFVDDECWRMVKVGDLVEDLGFTECGIVAQILEPLAEHNISDYYISTYYSDHTLIPESSLQKVKDLLNMRQKIPQSAKQNGHNL